MEDRPANFWTKILGCGCLHAVLPQEHNAEAWSRSMCYPCQTSQKRDWSTCVNVTKAVCTTHSTQRDSTHLQNIVDNSPALYSSSANIHGLMAGSFLKRFKQEWYRDLGSLQSKYHYTTAWYRPQKLIQNLLEKVYGSQRELQYI